MAFDYIVAGGGTAGLVIANRLSENPDITVAVIETGPDVRNDPGVLDIDLAGVTYSPDLDWNFSSTSQPQLRDRVIGIHAGKALGGTTVINGMYYIRGDKANYDAWELLGNGGWNWNTLFPYFLKSESFTIPTVAQASAGMTYEPQVHGENGHLKTGHPYQVENGTFHLAAQGTCESLGFALNSDIDSGMTRGYGSYPQTLDRDANVRESAARAYYEPIAGRPNLTIIRGTVQKITSGDNSSADEVVATGVQYTDVNGHLTAIAANKEVILSAGTYISPLILEASGIGNLSVLNRSNVKAKVELAGVGEGFQDQPLWVLMYQPTHNLTGHVPFAAFADAQHVFKNDLSSIATSTENNLTAWSEAIANRLKGGVSAEALKTRFQIQHDMIFTKNSSIAEFEFFSLGNILGSVFSPTLPFSWGSVHLNAAADIAKPDIDPNFLSIDYDLQTALRIGKMARTLWTTQPLSELVSAPVNPSQTVLPLNATDAQWIEFLTSNAGPASHSVGTCAMLPREMGGVVSPALKVYGTANIRVVDASVIPQLMSGHPSATIYALAEKAADIIKGVSIVGQDLVT